MHLDDGIWPETIDHFTIWQTYTKTPFLFDDIPIKVFYMDVLPSKASDMASIIFIILTNIKSEDTILHNDFITKFQRRLDIQAIMSRTSYSIKYLNMNLHPTNFLSTKTIRSTSCARGESLYSILERSILGFAKRIFLYYNDEWNAIKH